MSSKKLLSMLLVSLGAFSLVLTGCGDKMISDSSSSKSSAAPSTTPSATPSDTISKIPSDTASMTPSESSTSEVVLPEATTFDVSFNYDEPELNLTVWTDFAIDQTIAPITKNISEKTEIAERRTVPLATGGYDNGMYFFAIDANGYIIYASYGLGKGYGSPSDGYYHNQADKNIYSAPYWSLHDSFEKWHEDIQKIEIDGVMVSPHTLYDFLIPKGGFVIKGYYDEKNMGKFWLKLTGKFSCPTTTNATLEYLIEPSELDKFYVSINEDHKLSIRERLDSEKVVDGIQEDETPAQNFTATDADNPIKYTKIDGIAALVDDTTVSNVKGVITYLSNGNAIIEDEDGNAILVYDDVLKENYAVGDTIIIEGKKITYEGYPEIKDLTSIEKVIKYGMQDPVIPVDVTVDNVADVWTSANNYKLFKLVKAEVVSIDSNGTSKVKLGDTAISLDKASFPETVAVGDYVDVVCSMQCYNDDVQGRVASASDISRYYSISVDVDGVDGILEPEITLHTAGEVIELIAENADVNYQFSHWEKKIVGEDGTETWENIGTTIEVEITVEAMDAEYRAVYIDTTGILLPERVRGANLEIDCCIYVEGSNRRIPDIGNYSEDSNDTTHRYHPEDINYMELAPYFAAASAFNKVCPNVKINLLVYSIGEYNQMIQNYFESYGHLPHIMFGTDHVVEQLCFAYTYDLSRYAEESPYYNQYNEYLMSRFNFGGFQAAVPISAEPWGIFVNMNDLEKYNIVLDAIDDTYGQCTDEYKNWVDNFTWDSFVNAASTSNTETHAGLSKMVEYFTSYSVPSIYNQYIKEGTIDISSNEIQATITQLLEFENELSQYCVYNYNDTSYGPYLTAKEYFTNAAGWKGTENFVKDQYSTFYAEAPWALQAISQFVKSTNEQATIYPYVSPINTKVDFLPYPKLNSNSQAYTGIAVEGLTIGNQCPIGTTCTEDKQLKMDVAAYFAMFMGMDPLAIEARSKVKYTYGGRNCEGHMALPLIKRGVKYAWQEDEEYLLKHEDPAAGYDDNWQYQLAKWFEINDLYVTNDQPADVRTFTNITYGLVKMLDSIYMLDGYGDDYVTCLNYWNEPVAVPDVSQDVDEGKTKDIFEDWQERFIQFKDTENNAGVLGTSTYVATVTAQLANIENEINENSDVAWAYLAECVAEYYEQPYDITNKSYRNNYEGYLPN